MFETAPGPAKAAPGFSFQRFLLRKCFLALPGATQVRICCDVASRTQMSAARMAKDVAN